MGYDRQKVIDLALSQVGYHEKASNSELDDNTTNSGDKNWTKYARDLDQISGFYNGRKNGYMWCDIFVDWCFVKAYGREAAQELLCQPDNSAGAGCQYSAQYFRNRGQFHNNNPQPGDQIFFGASSTNVWHTGIVISVNANRVYTVEGNTADSVAKRTYTLNDSSIFGYGRPNWGIENVANDIPSEEPAKPEMPVVSEPICSLQFPLTQIGDKNGLVKGIQTLLIERGYDCGNRRLIGREKPDGDFGRTTEKAVAAFQRDKGLEVDGEVGPDTLIALLSNWG